MTPDNGAKVLIVKNLGRRYDEIEAVKGITFDIHKGEVFGLLGPNGAGKTTTISVLSTLMQPTTGNAYIIDRGTEHTLATDTNAVRGTIGLVPQDLSIYPTLSAAENVRFFGQMYGVQPKILEKRIDEVLDLVGLLGRRNNRAETFSGGMKRRLNLAVSLVHHPRLLFLDEPSVGVDPHSRERIFDIVRTLKESGTAILYTTHYMEEAELLCDRLGIMDEGQIVAIGTLDDLLTTMGCTESITIRGVPAIEIRARLGFHPSITDIEEHGEETRVYAKSSTSVLGHLQQIVERHPTANLQIAPMSLGDVFLHLTGKELRD